MRETTTIRDAGQDRFEGRFDYAAIGSLTNRSAPVCADVGDGELRVLAGLDDLIESDLVGDIRRRGFTPTVQVHTIRSLDAGR
jgi:hypothetical protein